MPTDSRTATLTETTTPAETATPSLETRRGGRHPRRPGLPCGNAYGPGDADAGFEHVTPNLAGYRTGSVSPADEEREADEAASTPDLDVDYPTRGR
jgi:hypothetical protein